MTVVLDQGLGFRLARDAFSEAVAWVARVLPQRPAQPVLAGIQLVSDDDGLRLSGFDYDVSAQVTVAAEVASPGSALVSGRLLSEIVKALPNKPVNVATEGSRVLLTCGSARFSLPMMAADDYPRLPELPVETGFVAGDVLAEAIGQVATAAGKDDTMPMLTGVRVELAGDRMVLAATDRFRLAVREVPWSPAFEGIDAGVLVPARTLAEVVKQGGGDVHLALGGGGEVGREGLLGVRCGARRSTARLLDVDFPKFRQLLPAEHTTVATLGTVDLMEALKRVALVADRGSQVRLEFSPAGLHLAAGGDDLGRAEEDLEADVAGEPLVIAFNPTYLIEGLGSMRCGRVTFGMSQASRPAVLRPAPDELPAGPGPFPPVESDYVYLLMPVRLPNA